MNWTLALPELVLALCGLAILVGGVLPKRDSTFAVSIATLGALLLAAALVLAQKEGTAFGGQYIADSFSSFMKVLCLLGAAMGLVLSMDFFAKQGLSRFEFPVLVLFATVGMMVTTMKVLSSCPRFSSSASIRPRCWSVCSTSKA